MIFSWVIMFHLLHVHGPTHEHWRYDIRTLHPRCLNLDYSILGFSGLVVKLQLLKEPSRITKHANAIYHNFLKNKAMLSI